MFFVCCLLDFNESHRQQTILLTEGSTAMKEMRVVKFAQAIKCILVSGEIECNEVAMIEEEFVCHHIPKDSWFLDFSRVAYFGVGTLEIIMKISEQVRIQGGTIDLIMNPDINRLCNRMTTVLNISKEKMPEIHVNVNFMTSRFVRAV